MRTHSFYTLVAKTEVVRQWMIHCSSGYFGISTFFDLIYNTLSCKKLTLIVKSLLNELLNHCSLIWFSKLRYSLLYNCVVLLLQGSCQISHNPYCGIEFVGNSLLCQAFRHCHLDYSQSSGAVQLPHCQSLCPLVSLIGWVRIRVLMFLFVFG